MDMDHVHERRKSFGAMWVALAIAVTAYAAPLPLWGVALVFVVTLVGLHMVAGLKLRWVYPDW
jgi:cell division protein FtsW (lipid II flippase)